MKQLTVYKNGMLLLLSHFSQVRLCVTPQTAAHQDPPSLGFSRQEHWSGLPFLSPMHESEKWKWSCSVESDPQQPHGLQPSRLLYPWDFLGKHTGVGGHFLFQGIFLTQWSNPHLVHWLAGSLPWTTWEVVSYDAKRFFNCSVHCKLSIRQYPHV